MSMVLDGEMLDTEVQWRRKRLVHKDHALDGHHGNCVPPCLSKVPNGLPVSIHEPML